MLRALLLLVLAVSALPKFAIGRRAGTHSSIFKYQPRTEINVPEKVEPTEERRQHPEGRAAAASGQAAATNATPAAATAKYPFGPGVIFDQCQGVLAYPVVSMEELCCGLFAVKGATIAYHCLTVLTLSSRQQVILQLGAAHDRATPNNPMPAVVTCLAGGDPWSSATCQQGAESRAANPFSKEKPRPVSQGLRLGDIQDWAQGYVHDPEHEQYTLMTHNCQQFSAALYSWFTGKQVSRYQKGSWMLGPFEAVIMKLMDISGS